MQGVQKFLQLLNDNWITILVCLGCVAGIVRKTVDFFSKSDDEKIKIAKSGKYFLTLSPTLSIMEVN